MYQHLQKTIIHKAKSILKTTIILLFLKSNLISVNAQQNHFIYLQTENKQPFYVRINKKVLSSSAAGYLILPKLTDGKYTLALGFPKNEWPEQIINCTVDKKDAGYLLKNFGDKGWGLFNWQTMQVEMAVTKKEEEATIAKLEPPPVVNSQPPVTEVAKVVIDTSQVVTKVVATPPYALESDKKAVETPVVPPPVVVAQPVVEKPTEQIVKLQPEKATEPKEPVVKKTEATPVLNTLPQAPTAKEVELPMVDAPQPQLQPAIVIERSKVVKLLSTNSTDGVDMIFIDVVNGKLDTIRVFMPTQREVQQTTSKKEEVSTAPLISDIKISNTDSPKPAIDAAEIKKEDKPKPDVKEIPQITVKKDERATMPVISDIKVTDVESPKPVANNSTSNQQNKTEAPKPIIKQTTTPSFITDVKVTNAPMPLESIPQAQKNLPTSNNKPSATIETNKNTEKPTSTTMGADVTSKPVVFQNSDCKVFATEEDFLKLRKKMAAENNDDDMVAIARKTFKAKCFTTQQLKNLSVLFLNDDGKYKFFDAAYPFVSDSTNFGSLQTVLTDEYYVNRFKAMLRR
jgi:hypothetical protein